MTAHSPRVPSRSVWNPAAIDDGSRTMVDLATGEIIAVPPSRQRAVRLATRAARHQAAAADRAAVQAETNRRGAQIARAALPKHTPIGLERPATIVIPETWRREKTHGDV